MQLRRPWRAFFLNIITSKRRHRRRMSGRGEEKWTARQHVQTCPTHDLWKNVQLRDHQQPGASPRSFDWGDGFRLGGRIRVSQNHQPKNANFSSDFVSFILEILGNLKTLPNTDMCQDPSHLFLWFKILNKIRKIIIYLCSSLWRLYPPFTSDSILSFSKAKRQEKCPRSCRSCGTLDPRSEWVFAHFHGV